MLTLDILGDNGGVASAASIELLTGKVALVVVANNTLEVGRRRRNLATAEEERTLEDVPAVELPVLLDDDAVHPGNEEEGDEESEGGTSGDNNAGNLGFGQVNFVVTALPEQQHSNEGAGKPEVDGDEHETLGGGV